MSVLGWIRKISLFSLPVILAGSVAVSQSVLPPDESLNDKPRKTENWIQIDFRALELAENYIYVLEQLKFLANDYDRYFTEINASLSEEYRAAVEEISDELAKGTYYMQITQLDSDLAELHEKLAYITLSQKKLQLDHQDAKTDLKKAQKLISSLSTELEVIQDMLENQVLADSGEYQKYSDAIDLYVKERYKEDGLKRIRFDEILPEISISIDSLPALSFPVILNVKPDEPHQIFIVTEGTSEPAGVEAPSGRTLSPPDAPDVPDVARSLDILYDKGDRGVRYVRVSADSSGKVSSSTPIYVHNPIGDINIVGWNRNYVRVNSDIVVSAESSKTAEEFAKQIHVRLYLKNDRLYVETEMPRLSDPDTKVTGSTVYVRLPNQNPVICQSSFGKIDVTGMRNSVKIKGEYCQVTTNDIEGNLVIANSFGEIISTGNEGPVSIKNSNGPIQLRACSGNMEIQNDAASITILGSEGTASIRNSGQISVIGHQGDVKIENEQGAVRVERVEGNLDVSSSMGEMNLQNVTGHVIAENAYSLINAVHIGGKVTARNRSGTIVLHELSGPLDINNERGTVDVVIDRGIAGASTINSAYGIVNVTFVERPNLTLVATALDGAIQSRLPVSTISDDKGSAHELKHTFGRGTHSLDITGKHTTIIINDEG